MSNDHLAAKPINDRGFLHMPDIPSTYGGSARVYESSAASGPHIWLAVKAPVNLNQPQGEQVDVLLHLTAVDALRLAEQLQHLERHHYQREPRPASTHGEQP